MLTMARIRPKRFTKQLRRLTETMLPLLERSSRMMLKSLGAMPTGLRG
jgi:hypothetical protein